MKIYLHIGYPKTGSTAIQWHVFANRRWFEERGVYIPRTGYWSGLGHAYLSSVGNTEFAAAPSDALAALVCELDACARQGYSAALLTWEGFALADASFVSALGEALAKYDVQLLAYVRDQASLFQSLVLQSVKTLKNLFHIPAIEQGVPVNGVPDYLDFHAVFALWESVFPGQFTVRVRLFDRACLREGDVVADFLHWLELDPDADFCRQREGINQSLSTEGALQLICARTAGLQWGGLIQLSRALTAAHTEQRGGSSHFLNASGVKQIVEHFAEGNSCLFERYRPENIGPDTCGFTLPRESGEQTEIRPASEYLRAVQRALVAPQLESWGGGHLKSKYVGRLVALPNHGWRAPEKTGAWSLGASSELAFTIPSTHPRCGPSAIRLILAGIYFEDHSVTRVIIGEHRELIDLRGEVVLTIPISEAVRADGVRVVLEHQFPSAAPDNADVNEAIAYKLKSASYDFVWS